MSEKESFRDEWFNADAETLEQCIFDYFNCLYPETMAILINKWIELNAQKLIAQNKEDEK